VVAGDGFVGQSIGMESNWAAEHLQVIRTLMERSAVYRRALAPIMIFNGVVGLGAAALGWALGVHFLSAFVLYWTAVAVIGAAGSFLLVRRQALKASEPFWSPPTRRVIQALLPPLTAGFLISAVMLLRPALVPPTFGGVPDIAWLTLSWVVLYGCAFHAAGFFMPRGMKLFGWAFILGGCLCFGIGIPSGLNPAEYAHAIMGLFFGGLHLAYGIYLYFTESRRSES
jgi:hypothetical protein